MKGSSRAWRLSVPAQNEKDRLSRRADAFELRASSRSSAEGERPGISTPAAPPLGLPHSFRCEPASTSALRSWPGAPLRFQRVASPPIQHGWILVTYDPRSSRRVRVSTQIATPANRQWQAAMILDRIKAALPGFLRQSCQVYSGAKSQ